MVSSHKHINISTIRCDLLGGLTAAVVALPLALAFGVSSGAGAIAGMYGAIILGFFAALFGGTATQISGPTGPMTVVMATIIIEFQAQSPETGLAIAFTTVMLAGLLQIIFGLLKLGRFFTLVPYTVISGFMSGIGVIIIIIQLAPLLGASSSPTIIQSLAQLPNHIHHINNSALAIGLLTLSILLWWPKRWKMLVPAALAALIAGTLTSLPLSEHTIPIIGPIPSGIPNIQLPLFDPTLLQQIIYSAFLLAMLGSIDSLLTSLVADKISHTQHNSNKELIGQGIGNILAGMFGGLPGAGATMRTVVNIKSGSKTRLSGIVHALVLTAIVLGAGSLAEHIPHAVLAAILLKVGIDIIDWQFIFRTHKMPLYPTCLMLTVLLLTVFYDLISAVIVGVFITNLVTISRLSELQKSNIILSNGQTPHPRLTTRVNQQLKSLNSTLLLSIKGTISYGAAQNMPQQLRHYNHHPLLIIDPSKATLVNLTTRLQIDDIIRDAIKQHSTVLLVGPEATLEKHFRAFGTLSLISNEQRFKKLSLALNYCAIKAEQQ